MILNTIKIPIRPGTPTVVQASGNYLRYTEGTARLRVEIFGTGNIHRSTMRQGEAYRFAENVNFNLIQIQRSDSDPNPDIADQIEFTVGQISATESLFF